MGLRRAAREYALQILYAFDCNKKSSIRETIQIFRENFPEIPNRGREFAESLVIGVSEHLIEIDEAIAQRSKNWVISRMPKVDLNVMRLAAFELMFREDIPKKVSINEAIDISRLYGDKDSSSFVNGILDDIKTCPKNDENGEEK